MAVTSQTDSPGGPAILRLLITVAMENAHYFISKSALTQLTHSSVVPHPFWAPRGGGGGEELLGVAFPGGPRETVGQAGQGAFRGHELCAAQSWGED